jgi:hypothetical protein
LFPQSTVHTEIVEYGRMLQAGVIRTAFVANTLMNALSRTHTTASFSNIPKNIKEKKRCPRDSSLLQYF